MGNLSKSKFTGKILGSSQNQYIQQKTRLRTQFQTEQEQQGVEKVFGLDIREPELG